MLARRALVLSAHGRLRSQATSLFTLLTRGLLVLLPKRLLTLLGTGGIARAAFVLVELFVVAFIGHADTPHQ
jgi:hypothetical protein